MAGPHSLATEIILLYLYLDYMFPSDSLAHKNNMTLHLAKAILLQQKSLYLEPSLADKEKV